ENEGFFGKLGSFIKSLFFGNNTTPKTNYTASSESSEDELILQEEESPMLKKHDTSFQNEDESPVVNGNKQKSLIMKPQPRHVSHITPTDIVRTFLRGKTPDRKKSYDNSIIEKQRQQFRTMHSAFSTPSIQRSQLVCNLDFYY